MPSDHCGQGSTYLFEKLSWKCILLQPFFVWRKMKTYSLTSFPSSWDNIFLTVSENKFIVWNNHFSGPTSTFLLEFGNINSGIKCKIYSKLTIEAPDVVLVSLMLTLNILDMFFWVFLQTLNMEMADGLLYCLKEVRYNKNLSMKFL